MSMSNYAIRLLSAGSAVLTAAFALPGAASAQLFFDWGGGSQKVNDSGRQPVRINVDAKPGEIIVSFTDRKLYLITGPGQAISYPVAIPREQDRWEGKTTVTQKRENPSWTPTPTMIKENPRLPRWVPGGHPMNPLGNRALYLGSSFYRIHGTDAPWTIGTAVSKGCIRMYNKDALDVYERSKVGARVLVTWNKYDTKPEGEPGQSAAAAAQEEAPTVRRASTQPADRAGPAPVPAAAAAAAVLPAAAAAASTPTTPAATAPASSSERKVAQSGSRYSDIFGTPEPPAPSTPAARPSGQPSAPAQAQPRPSRPASERDVQAPREPRKSKSEGNAATGNAEGSAASAPKSRTSEPKAAAGEPKAKAAPVETGSLSERNRARPKAAPEQPAAAAAAAPQIDVATKALEAAERAAAAAERAAAAAERAERALAARAAAVPAAAVVAPAVAPAVAAPVAVPAPAAAAPSPATSPGKDGGGD